jgi:hypothetical protein
VNERQESIENESDYIIRNIIIYTRSVNLVLWGRDCSAGIATGYGLDGRGKGFFSPPQRPDRFWGTPALLLNGYRGRFPWG